MARPSIHNQDTPTRAEPLRVQRRNFISASELVNGSAAVSGNFVIRSNVSFIPHLGPSESQLTTISEDGQRENTLAQPSNLSATRVFIRDSLTGNISSIRLPNQHPEISPLDFVASSLGFQPQRNFELPFTSNFSATTARQVSFPEQLRRKHVYELNCKYCCQKISERAMRAILLSDVKIELFSTDSPPRQVETIFHDYDTSNCSCKIRDFACCQCGNTIGYHVSQPCSRCLEAKNNGHFWMFYAQCVIATYRLNARTKAPLAWGVIDSYEQELHRLQPNCGHER